jgi:hypothetical protein
LVIVAAAGFAEGVTGAFLDGVTAVSLDAVTGGLVDGTCLMCKIRREAVREAPFPVADEPVITLSPDAQNEQSHKYCQDVDRDAK